MRRRNMFINHSAKEVTAKIVFYGPGLSGKTTCLQYIFSVTNPSTRGELISIETEVERTLFFDLLPVNVGLVMGYQTKFQLYTVPGQVFYDSTRKLVLKGADGIVFVADSQKMMERPNLDSMENLKKNLAHHKQGIDDVPMVFQYNKRDLKNTFSIEELNKILNPRGLPFFGSVATEGKGVLEALRAISSLILGNIKHLLDQTEEELEEMPPVDFDTNKKYKIIDKDNLPFKKIQTDSFEAISKQMNFTDSEMEPIDGIKASYPEEELKVETVEEVDDLKDIMFNQEEPMAAEPFEDLEEFKIDDPANKDRESKKTNTPKQKAENKNVPNIPEIDELDKEEDESLGKTVVETDVDASGFKEMEEIVNKEIKKEKQVEQPDEEIEIELDQEPFQGLQDIPLGMDEEPGPTKIQLEEPVEPVEEEIEELEDIGELVAEGDVKKTAQVPKNMTRPDDTGDMEPFKLEDEVNLDINETPFQELEEVKEIEQEVPFKELEDVKEVEMITEVNKEEIKEVEELKKTLEKEKKNKENKQIPFTKKGMDLFEQLKDKTRLTVIREVPAKGPDAQLLIDIKDGDSKLLESLKVKITPEIKKITLILDVKK
jgi:signal recognition particle receptor subunit beta